MPLRLSTFGGLSLTGESGPLTGAAAQRRKLALLAVLATGGERGVSRDRLLALFWPESDTEHARHALTQALSALRRELGSEDVFLGTADLRLNPALIESDVAAFEAAVARSEWEGAAALYVGPFLDAVHLDHAHQSPEFERWVEIERSRLSGLASAALERLAVDAGARGDHHRAVQWWRRLAVLDPYSTQSAAGLITALAAAGDTVAALRHAQVYKTLLQDELNREPDETVLAIVRRIGRGTQPLPEQPPYGAGDSAATPIGGKAVVGVAADRAHARRWRVRRVPLLGGVAGVGVLLVGGWFLRSRSGGDPPPPGPKMLAVLPFENLGRPEDDYFADGITDEVRGKLAMLPGLTVIARTSSAEYKKTTKPATQISRELGVQYLLTATVRWETSPDGTRRVRVSPEVVQVTDGRAPVTKWEQPFDAALRDVFQVQTDIATRVAQALDVALNAGAEQQLAERPTQNLAAYDAFLRGEAASQSMTAFSDWRNIRRALPHYEQAVALDPTFVQAWAQLARAQAHLYLGGAAGHPTPAEAEAARQAADRAVALAPNRPDGHLALGTYYGEVLIDIPRALAEDSTALALSPGSVRALGDLAWSEMRYGRWEAARAHYEQVQRLDPRDVGAARVLGIVLIHTRHYPEALHAVDVGLAFAPADLQLLELKAMVALAQGDLAGARAVLCGGPREVDTALVAYVATIVDLTWVLDDAQQALLLRLRPSAFDGDRGDWGLTLAEIYALRGDSGRARVYADSARLTLEKQLRAAPTFPGIAQLHGVLGEVLVYLGRKAEAVREGERAVAIVPIARDALTGAFNQAILADIYVRVGEKTKALDLLEPLLRVPFIYSPGWLRLDPRFAPLRGNPRFERLAAGK